MNRIYLLLLFFFFYSGVEAQQHPSLCSPSPEAVEVTQPDGSTLFIIGHGNMLLNYSRTVDGYTVLPNNEGFCEYADEDNNGNLVLSGVIASNPEARAVTENTFLQRVQPHLAYSEVQQEQLLKTHFEPSQAPGIHDEIQNVKTSFPNKGKQRILLLLIEYPDLPAIYSVSDFHDLMNEPGFKGTGSFRDYYLEISKGELELDIDVHGWYMAKNGYEYYGNQNGTARARGLVAEAVDAAYLDGIDFSIYDNNGNGEVDGVFIVHSGPGAEEGGRRQYVWSHRWTLSNQARYYNGVKINDYVINPETRTTGGIKQVGIGVLAHEFGHLLGLPDLYDTDDNNGSSNGIGSWCLMSSGNWLNGEKTPAIMSAWCRDQLSWISPVVINTDGEYTLPVANTGHTCYRINTQSNTEYFLLENRQKRGFDAALPGEGLAIWHINTEKTSLTNNRVNADHTNKGVELKEADGKNDLDMRRNRGDAGDLYPGITNNISFTPFSTPSSNLRDGSITGIEVNYIAINPDSTLSFFLGKAPVAVIQLPKHDFCIGEHVFVENKSVNANFYSWTFEDTLVNDFIPDLHFYTSGEYYLKLEAATQSGYRHSDSVLVRVHDYAFADFTTTLDDTKGIFESHSQNANSLSWFIDDHFASSDETYIHWFNEPGKYIISLVAANDAGCNDTTDNEISIYNLEGLDNNFSAKFFPNPFHSFTQMVLNIENNEQPVQLEIFSIEGRKIYNAEMALDIGKHKLDFNTSVMNQGIYLVRLSQGEQNTVLKLVKQ